MRLCRNYPGFPGPLLVLLALMAWAPSSAGTVRKTDNGVVVRVGNVDVRLRVCDARTVQVTVSRADGPARRHPSLVVLKRWPKVPWRLEHREGEGIVLRTARLSASVDPGTGAITFRDSAGSLLVREDPTAPHEIVPAAVAGEATFHVLERLRPSPDEAFYGLGQFEDGLMNYRGHEIVLAQNNRHIVVPFLVSSRRYGIYWDNYSDTRFHDGPDGTTLLSEVGDGINYYLISGSSVADVIAGYREATGRVPMFPRWAFGYWQSKERYENQDQLMSVAREYRRRQIPIDNIVQDWQYWGSLGWNAMDFDRKLYPDPKGMIDSLHRLYKLHLMLSIWPQVDSATPVFRELKAKGHLYPTTIWNGGKTYDAYSPEARDIYWKYLDRGLYTKGVDAWWVDATEPDSAFCETPLEEKIGIVANGMTALGTSSRYLNTYALMTTTGIYQHQRRANPARRVVMLTRSAFAGQQRNSMAVWSGDIASTWNVFRNQIAGGVNIGMAGIPWWNSDIGGFLPKEYGGQYPLGPRDSAYVELYVRWFQFGAFCPIFRSHGTDFGKEVWQFGEPGSWGYDALARMIDLRYRLIPYIYTAAWEVTDRHATMMRGLPIDFTTDRRALVINDEYMFGPAFLVAPVTSQMYYPKNPSVLVPAACLRTAEGLPGLTGHYFRGKNFDSLAFTRRDTAVRFQWTETGPPGVGRENYTVRWNGKLLAPETGTYQFEVTSDDGVNLWIDGRQLLDEMYPAGVQMNVGETDLAAGSWHDIVFEYQQLDKHAEVFLGWRTPSSLKAYAPDHGVRQRTVYLPSPAAWTDFWSGLTVSGGAEVQQPAPIDVIPLFVRAGSIVPMGPRMQYTGEKPSDPLELRVYPGRDGWFTLYEDEGDGYGYEQGRYSLIPFAWNQARRTLTIGPRRGSFPGMLPVRTLNIVLVRPGHGVGIDPSPQNDAVLRYTGKAVTVRLR